METSQKVLLRLAFTEFVDLNKFVNPFSVTLTLKQSVVGYNGVFPVHTRIDQPLAVKNFRHFMNQLNRRVYGPSFRRYGKRVQVIPVIEGGGPTRLHYHCVIDCPRSDLVLTFPTLIRECWSKTDFGYDQIDIQNGSDCGWINYISKFRSKTEFDLSIDWINLHQN